MNIAYTQKTQNLQNPETGYKYIDDIVGFFFY